MKAEKLSITVSESIGSVSAELIMEPGYEVLFVFAHGAGAGMHHPFMVKLSGALAALKIGTLRYHFPYMEKGSKRPDPPAIAEKAVVRALETAHHLYPGVPLIAGGKSFGGRMTSQALSKNAYPQVQGIIFVGFPLHPAGQPGTDRSRHLKDVAQPMLFLQGSRDALADIHLVERVCAELPRATLKKFEGADHSFKAGKQDLIPALAQEIKAWTMAAAVTR